MINEFGWQGLIEILVNGKFDAIIYNRVMDEALDQLAKSLMGIAPDIEIKYLAVGTSNTAVTNTQTQLVAEIFRTPITVPASRTSVGVIQNEFVVLDSEAVAQIEEIGIFGGSTATAVADTGILISRVLWSKNKSNSEEISFKRIDKVVRG